MDAVTEKIVDLIESTDIVGRTDLIEVAKLAFLDYIASLSAAKDLQAVQELANFVGDRPEDKALYYGFTSHYLDLDDAQANLAGHFSTVLYSALLAVLVPEDTWQDIFRAYTIGAELEGIIGSLINPEHRSQGWHSTGTVGVIGAAAAIGALRGLHGESLVSLLSLSATQSSGMAFQSGSDGKALHAGLAARNAVWAYALLNGTSLMGSMRPFNNDTGWFRTIAGIEVALEDIEAQWMQPGQIISPGLWMKIHPYCSAAICGAEAAAMVGKRLMPEQSLDSELNDVVQHMLSEESESAEKQTFSVENSDGMTSTLLMDNIDSVTIHFPPNADKALKFTRPTTGREGQFSIEYIVAQVLLYGEVRDELFFLSTVPIEIADCMERMERVYDLPPVEQTKRITTVTVQTTTGDIYEATVTDPKGSPQNSLTLDDIKRKLTVSLDKTTIDELLEAFTGCEVYEFVTTLKKRGVLHV